MAASIHCLPSNILYQIFLQYLDIPRIRNASKPTVRCSHTTFSTPLPLSHVCSLWRKVACSSPKLWSSIYVLGPSARQLPLIKLWLKRSGKLPLTLGLTQMIFRDPVPVLCDATNQVLSLYFHYSSRWKSISFAFADSNVPPLPAGAVLLFSYPNLDNLPLLESVQILDNRGWEPGPRATLWSQILSNKSLRGVNCSRAGIRHANLTELTCHSPVPYQLILETLRDCPNLEAFDVPLSPAYGPYHELVPPPLTHMKLRQFRLRNRFDPNLTVPLLQKLTVPRLIELDVVPDNDKNLVLALHDMVVRSNCSLCSIRMVPADVATEEVVKFFQLPQLRGLTRLAMRNPSTELLEFLALRPRSSRSASRSAGKLALLNFIEIEGLRSKGLALSDFLTSRLSSLERAIVVGGVELDEMPLSDKLWAHPGIEFRVYEGSSYHDILRAHPGSQIRTSSVPSAQ